MPRRFREPAGEPVPALYRIERRMTEDRAMFIGEHIEGVCEQDAWLLAIGQPGEIAPLLTDLEYHQDSCEDERILR